MTGPDAGQTRPGGPLQALLLAMGSLGVLGFLGTGQYMKYALDGMQGMPDLPRLLYRSAHIYLLWAGLANLLAGMALAPTRQPLAGWLQRGAGGLLSVTVPLFAASFFVESPQGLIDRPLASLGNYLGGAGVVLAVYAAWLGQAPGRR